MLLSGKTIVSSGDILIFLVTRTDDYQADNFDNYYEIALNPQCTTENKKRGVSLSDYCIFAKFQTNEEGMTSIAVNKTVTFNNLSYRGAYEYIWQVIDEYDEVIFEKSYDYVNDFSYQFTVPGLYTVALTATNADETVFDTDKKMNYIHVISNDLNADFTYDHSNTTAGQTIKFNDKSSSGESTITKWEWEVLKDNGSKNEH